MPLRHSFFPGEKHLVLETARFVKCPTLSQAVRHRMPCILFTRKKKTKKKKKRGKEKKKGKWGEGKKSQV